MARPLHLLLSAGPTREPLDPVRFISNYSTGYMGVCLAAEAHRRRWTVTAVLGPGVERPSAPARIVSVERSDEMARAMRQEARRADAVIMAAAVCDYRPKTISKTKLLRRGSMTLELEATTDIIGTLPRRKGQVVVGFALETQAPLRRAAEKLRRKRLDLIVAQWARGHAGPFGDQPVRAWLIDAASATPLGAVRKPELARAILDKVEGLCYGGLPAFRHAGRLRAPEAVQPRATGGPQAAVCACA